MNALTEKYPKEIDHILAKYPPDNRRAAVMPLLYLAQREHNYVSRQSLEDIAELTGVTTTEVASIVGYYTLYHDKAEGKIHIQVCTDLPCALRGADRFLEDLCQNIGIRVGETTPDGMVTIEEVKCLAGCNHAPVLQVQSGDGLTYHEDQTVESALALVDRLRKGKKAERRP